MPADMEPDPPVPAGFELYRRVRPPEVAVYRGGFIRFSPAAFARLGSPAAVVFLLDRAEHVLGFRPAGRGEPNAYAVLNRGVLARRPLACLDADVTATRRYPLAESDEGVPYITVNTSGAG